MFLECQRAMRKQKTHDFTTSGSCACAVLVHGNWVYSINLGDSRCVMCY